jgi:hypothetical protein
VVRIFEPAFSLLLWIPVTSGLTDHVWTIKELIETAAQRKASGTARPHSAHRVLALLWIHLGARYPGNERIRCTTFDLPVRGT